MGRYLIALLVIAGGLVALQSWRLDQSQVAEALASDDARRAKEATDIYAKAYDTQREGLNHANTKWQNAVSNSERRRIRAERLYSKVTQEIENWRALLLPAGVTYSLCIEPGSCTVPEPTGQPPDPGAGTTPEGSVQLTNQSVRDGIEDLRAALSQCNAQLAGLSEWAKILKTNE